MILINKQFEKYSKSVCDKVDVEEGEIIGAKLLQELSNSKNGIGLAAPQIGITKRVCVINVKEPLVFINPEIIESDGEFIFKESCLSYPKKVVPVKRHTMITIDANNLDEPLVFDLKISSSSEDILEIACIQHEIDHLDGITMFDRKFVREPIKAEKKYGRNEIVIIMKKDKKHTKKLKWKKAKPLIDSGSWEIFTYSGGLKI
jgi:peptide deformylase